MGAQQTAKRCNVPSIDITQWVGSGSAVFGIEGLFLAGMDGGFGPFDGFLEFVLELRKGDGTLLRDQRLREINLTRAVQQIEDAKGCIMTAAHWRELTITRVPVIYIGHYGGPLDFATARSAYALTPNLANMQVAEDFSYFARPEGPRTIGGDPFENWILAAESEAKLVRSWEYYHLHNGDVHCGTNVEREPFDYDWWTTRIE